MAQSRNRKNGGKFKMYLAYLRDDWKLCQAFDSRLWKISQMYQMRVAYLR